METGLRRCVGCRAHVGTAAAGVMSWASHSSPCRRCDASLHDIRDRKTVPQLFGLSVQRCRGAASSKVRGDLSFDSFSQVFALLPSIGLFAMEYGGREAWRSEAHEAGAGTAVCAKYPPLLCWCLILGFFLSKEGSVKRKREEERTK